jgi:hypothetical protein
VFEVAEQPACPGPMDGERSVGDINFHQKQLSLFQFAEASDASRIGTVV